MQENKPRNISLKPESTCPEISCNMQAPHLLFKPKIFSQVFDTSSLGIKPTSWAAQLPGSWLQHWVTPRKRPPREPAKTVHHPTLAIGNPAAAIQWDPAAGKRPQLSHNWGSQPVQSLRQWGTYHEHQQKELRTQKEAFRPVAHQIHFTKLIMRAAQGAVIPCQWSHEMVTSTSSSWEARHPRATRSSLMSLPFQCLLWKGDGSNSH